MPHTSRRQVVLGTAVVVAVAWIGAVLLATSAGSTWWRSADFLTGVALVFAGAVAAAASSPAGWWVILAGATWFIGNLSVVDVAWVAGAARHLRFVHRGALALAVQVVARRRPATARPAIAVVAVLAALTVVDRLLREPWVIVGWSLAVALAALTSLRGADTVPVVALGLTGVMTGIALACTSPPHEWVTSAYQLGLLCVVASVAVVALHGRTQRRRLADTIVEVALGPASELRAVLGEALGDPDVDVAFTVGGGWVDEGGRAREAIPERSGRTIVDITVDGRCVAQVGCLERMADSAVVRSIDRATSLVSANVRLRAASTLEAARLEASRRRLLVAAGEQRVRLTAELEAMTTAPLAELEILLTELGADAVGDAADVVALSQTRLRLLREDLHALGSGLGPTALSTGDLATALRQLVATSGLDPAAEVGQVDLEPSLSAAVYYVAAEAVSNAVKHAAARTLVLHLTALPGTVGLEVIDDGIGGARFNGGSGLRGLADRVAAFHGTLTIDSRPGEGTAVRVWFPVQEPADTLTQGTPK